jgi:Asp-tRNA(Asn)/Glu-tRNA(Gln) amidotransferase C subunit
LAQAVQQIPVLEVLDQILHLALLQLSAEVLEAMIAQQLGQMVDQVVVLTMAYTDKVQPLRQVLAR